jgi:EAL domain-containing protein (putative c-di-GMP-specific phosphodiesterase class I)
MMHTASLQMILSTPCSNRLSQAPSSLTSDGVSPPPSLEALWDLVPPDELFVVFQPIVDMANGETRGFEALLRCEGEAVSSPATLFDLAATLGVAGWLGRLVREICVPLASGHPLFVNVHPQELGEDWLVRDDEPIFAHDADVYLEVTESAPLHGDAHERVLAEVGARGTVFLAMDDLGAGHSDLLRLVDLKPRVVKLDRALVEELQDNERKRELVRMVVELCTRLGAEVIAEGIETYGEYQALLRAGVRYGQGFLFARPGFPFPEVHWPPTVAVTMVPPAD